MKINHTWILIELTLACFTISNSWGEKISNPFLWKVEGPENPVYLFGSMHQGFSLEDMPFTVMQALDQSHTVIAECRDSAPPQDRMWLSAGPPLDAMLGPALWDKLLRHTDRREISIQSLKRLRPYVASTYLQGDVPGPPSNGGSADMDLDGYLLQAARTQGKQENYLESMQEHFDFIERVYTIDCLKKVLDHLEIYPRIDTLYRRAYVSGDEPENVLLDSQMEWTECDGNRKNNEERNRLWLPKIQGYIQQGGVFIVVGLGHLIGEQGLIQTLSEKGYKISRILRFPNVDHSLKPASILTVIPKELNSPTLNLLQSTAHSTKIRE